MPPVNVDDFRDRARRRLPKIFFDYIDGGAFAEETLRANRNDFGSVRLNQRVLAGTKGEPDLSASYLGVRHPLPFMLGPVGFLGLYSGSGEKQAMLAAHDAGIPFCLSTFSIASLSDLRPAARGPLHFQLYMLTDRSLCDELLAEAARADVGTLFVTVDTAITAVRERDVRNGFRTLTHVTPKLLLNLLRKPAWLWDVARHGMPSVRAFDHRAEFGRGALEQAGNLSSRIDSALSWQDIAWLRQRWPGKLAIKGIMAAEDAIRARDVGADAIVISNHGGRQLDGVASTVSSISPIRDALGNEFCVMMDGGVRRGGDVVKALALGADGVLLGRAYTYALAAAGQQGVADLIAILSREISISLKLMGLSSIAELRADGLRRAIV